MNWFEKLTGFRETNHADVQAKIVVKNDRLTSTVNNQTYQIGKLQVCTLKELREELLKEKGMITVSEVIGDAQELHKDLENIGAVFQVASQFNLLEMVGPEIMPENGITRYQEDYTQGPACAIACGAATIFRNYFVEVNGKTGQTRNNQIDCLDKISDALGNSDSTLWSMKNGYVIARKEGLDRVTSLLEKQNKVAYQELKDKLKVDIQWNTQVTIDNNKQLVNQIFCSALPVSYSQVSSEHWEPFARFILEATYETTFYTALLNHQRTGNKLLYLTLVGGSAFGNKMEWIIDAIKYSLKKFKETPLDVRIVSYRSPNPIVAKLLNQFSS